LSRNLGAGELAKRQLRLACGLVASHSNASPNAPTSKDF
jgi:hypothetical protein